MAYPQLSVPQAAPQAQPAAAAKPPKATPKGAALRLLDPGTLSGLTGTKLSAQHRERLDQWGGLMEQLAPLDQFQRALIKGPIEELLSETTGRKITIPDPEEWELQSLQRERALLTERKALLQEKVDDIQSTIFDNQEALAQYGITPDTLGKEPEKWVEFVQTTGGNISMGDLMRLGLVETPEQAAAGKLKADAEAGRERESLGKTTLSEAERVQQVATGSGEFGALANDMVDNIEQARGADTTFDIDTAAGSAAALDFYDQLKTSPLGQILGKRGVANAVLQRFKDDITDNLEGLGQDAQGRLQAKGDLGVEDDAVVNLMTLIGATANDLGVAPADVLKGSLGLSYSGFDDATFGAALLKRSGGDPAKVRDFLKKYGLKVQ